MKRSGPLRRNPKKANRRKNRPAHAAFAAELDAITESLFDRAGYRCEVRHPKACMGDGAPLNRHHRVRRGQPGCTNDLGNLILVCGSGTMGCHGYIHSHPAESFDRGWLVRVGGDPAAIPFDRWKVLKVDA